MRLKTKLIVAGVVVAGVSAGVAVMTYMVKRRAKRILEQEVRTALNKAVSMKVEDYIPGGAMGKSLFRRYLESLSNGQLVALCALMQVGHFVKVSGINSFHPTKEQIAKAAGKYLLERHLAPKVRDEMLNALDTTDAFDALRAASRVLSRA